MRIFLPFLFCLASNLSIAQVPEGTYAMHTGDGYTEIRFREGNRFTYSNTSCVWGQHGSGRYTAGNNRIILQFEVPDSTLMSPVTSFLETRNDSIIIDFHFFNPLDTTPVQGVSVQYRNERYGVVSNANGDSRMKIASKKLPVEIEVSYVGASPAKISFNERGIYTIRYPVDFAFEKLAEGKRMEFQFRISDKGDLLLKPKDSRMYQTYTRKNN